MAKKNESATPVSAANKGVDFNALKPAITINIAGTSLVGTLRDFSTGSKGYMAHGKVVIDGIKFQVNVNVVAINSK